MLADTVHTAHALDQPDYGPGQVVVDDDGAVLKVLAFAQDVCCDEDAEFIFRLDSVALLVACRAKAPGEGGGVG